MSSEREMSAQERKALRENAKRVLRESGLADMLQSINKNLLKGRGRFEEYDSMILFKWGTGYTLRHIWVEVEGNTIRFRLAPHLKCSRPAPLCDGEYHTLTSTMWMDHDFLQAELKKYYDKPVAETSSD
ncbi:MAG TPA: hypothetical protein VII61_22505 [Ktedonobacteraceae bacterium]|jgi:hypothetical protein